jgi:hypothetical protein
VFQTAPGLDFVNTDFSVIRHFVPRKGMRIDLRTEFFSLFNHPQFGAPGLSGYGADLASPSTFAVVDYTVNNPRLVQFALKPAFERGGAKRAFLSAILPPGSIAE